MEFLFEGAKKGKNFLYFFLKAPPPPKKPYSWADI